MSPKLPILTFKKVVKILNQNGFELDHTTGSHYIFYNRKNKKRATVPYHTKDLPKGTLLSIIKQAGLSKDNF
jgi:predicted RNA binding protein YcfA (HicA-like mRNA interferase family)